MSLAERGSNASVPHMTTPPAAPGTNYLLTSVARARWLAAFVALAIVGFFGMPLFGASASDAIFSACFATLPVLLGPLSKWAGWSTIAGMLAAVIDLAATPGSTLTIGPNALTDWAPVILRLVAVVFGFVFIVKSSAGDPATANTLRHFKDIVKKRPFQLPIILVVIIVLAMVALSFFFGLPLFQS
jgi:hypothetical protein